MASATDVHYWVLPDKEEPQLLTRSVARRVGGGQPRMPGMA